MAQYIKKTSNLFQPITFGKLKLKNRIVMSAMARMRCDPNTHCIKDMHIDYYTQRASAGMIITEPVSISEDAYAANNCAGLTNQTQVDLWKKVNDAVHKKEGVIFAQLAHNGRLSLPKYSNGHIPIAPSKIFNNKAIVLKDGAVHQEVENREMTEDDIKRVLDLYYDAARKAKEAGFDGVQIHASSGALLDSFIRSSTNKRKDKWGGKGGNDLVCEVLKRVKEVFESSLITIKISPTDQYNNIMELDPEDKFNDLIEKITKIGIGSIEIKEAKNSFQLFNNFILPTDQISNCYRYFGPFIRKKSKLISNFSTMKTVDAFRIIDNDEADLVSMATLFISNPDLVERLKNGYPIVFPKVQSFYGNTEEGFIDYPSFKQ